MAREPEHGAATKPRGLRGSRGVARPFSRIGRIAAAWAKKNLRAMRASRRNPVQTGAENYSRRFSGDSNMLTRSFFIWPSKLKSSRIFSTNFTGMDILDLFASRKRARMISAAHTVLSACIVSLGASALGLCVLVPISRPFGLLDYPDARKRHGFATPLVGGLSIFVGMLAGWMWLGQAQHFDDVVLGTGCMLVLL
ncbi:MAG: hypothetical protein KGJ46_12935, partial [Xanthomonadaceae bacterium]|nr:hypothetical protein [Xanthomonadaceae bacterium]